MNEHGAPNVVDGGRVRRLTVDDLMRVWELTNKAERESIATGPAATGGTGGR